VAESKVRLTVFLLSLIASRSLRSRLLTVVAHFGKGRAEPPLLDLG
jgi:hypothetical protein